MTAQQPQCQGAKLQYSITADHLLALWPAGIESLHPDNNILLVSMIDSQKMTPSANQYSLPIRSVPTHPKGPKAKDDDDEVNDVGEEHESVDVSGSSVLGVKDPPEETLGRLVHFVHTAVNNTTDS